MPVRTKHWSTFSAFPDKLLLGLTKEPFVHKNSHKHYLRAVDAWKIPLGNLYLMNNWTEPIIILLVATQETHQMTSTYSMQASH